MTKLSISGSEKQELGFLMGKTSKISLNLDVILVPKKPQLNHSESFEILSQIASTD